MKEQEQALYLLITRYLSGQTTTEENEWLMEWRAADRQHAQTFAEIADIWQGCERSPDAASLSVLHKLHARIAADAVAPVAPRRVWLYRVAAAAAVLVVAGAAWHFLSVKPAAHKAADLVAATLAGEQKTVVLEDGTRVVLGPESVLAYPASFDKDHRSVTVTGQAYFEVAAAPHQPFSVQTHALTIRVLGTHFGVNATSGQALTSVALLEGAVKVILKQPDNKNEYLLKPGQELAFNENTKEIAQYDLDSTDALGWRNNILKCKNEPLGAVAMRIEKMYGVKIVFSSAAAAATRIYATFNNQPLDSVMGTICASGVLAYHHQGDTIYVMTK